MIEKIVSFFENHNVIVRGIALVFGCFICATVYNLFAVPNNIVYGGFGGLSIVINKFTGIPALTFLNISITLSLVISIVVMGFKHTLHSIIGYLVYFVMLNLTSKLFVNVSITFDSFLFTCVFFGILSGIGSGLIYRSGFDTGGMDTLVTILRDRYKMPFAKIGTIVNGIIIALGIVSFGYIKAIYAICTLYIINNIADFVLIGLSSKKMVFINCKKTNELIKFIEQELDTGYTLLQSTNGIGIFKRTIVMCVVPTYRFYTLKAKVHELDNKALLYSHDCYSVVGGRTNQIVAF